MTTENDLRITTTAARSERRSSGFTLIEVMIVVAIIAILAMVATPSYRNYILRGAVVDGTTLLATASGNMERYFQDNRTYEAVGPNIPPCSAVQPVARPHAGQLRPHLRGRCDELQAHRHRKRQLRPLRLHARSARQPDDGCHRRTVGLEQQRDMLDRQERTGMLKPPPRIASSGPLVTPASL